MARIRTVKPDFFRHSGLYDAEKETGLPLRIAFAGLWTAADREGRFTWRPKELKLDCLPHDDVDFSRVLDALFEYGFVLKYSVNGSYFGSIPSWKDHQVINQREAKSKIPPPPDSTETHVRAHAHTLDLYAPRGVNIPLGLRATVFARDNHKCVRCGASEDLTVDHIFPQSMGGTHALANLRTLCRACNSSRPVAGQGLVDDLKRDGLTLADMERICMHVHARGEGKGKEGKGKENIVRADADEFDEWYESYPRKEGRGYALKAYRAALRKVDAATLLSGAKAAAERFQHTERRFIPLPATWLNGERWADQVTSYSKPMSEADRIEAAALRGVEIWKPGAA